MASSILFLIFIYSTAFFSFFFILKWVLPILHFKQKTSYNRYKNDFFQRVTRQFNVQMLGISPHRIFQLSIGGAILLTIMGSILTKNIFLTLVFGGIGYWAPKLLLQRWQALFLERFELQLIDGLTLMNNGLRAGLNLLQTVDLVIKEMPPPLSREFGTFKKELGLGESQEIAWMNFSQRIRSEYLDLMITAILIARKTGGNLSEILENIAQVIVDKNKMQGKIKSLTAQGRMQGVVIGLLPIALLFAVSSIDPQYIQPLLSTFIGKCLLVGAGGMLLLGGLWIRKIVNIDI